MRGQGNSRKIRRPILGLLLLLGVALALSSCGGGTQALVVSYSPFESTALVWVAEAEGFFAENGLEVTFRKYDTGPAALDAMLKGEADIAVGTGEFPMVGKVLQGEKPTIVASISRSELINIVARKDRGIEGVADLKGKRVGTTMGTIAEYFLGRSLELSGLSAKDLAVIDVRTPDEWVNAVVSGDVDAVCTAEPYSSSAADALGTNAVKWSAHGGQPLYALAISRREWIEEKADTLARFLRSLDRAEEYAAQNSAQAKIIVQENLGLTAEYMEAAWDRNDFRLSLDESLVAAMESEVRWMIRGDLTPADVVPNLLDHVSEGALADVRPEAVRIIR